MLSIVQPCKNVNVVQVEYPELSCKLLYLLRLRSEELFK